MSLPVPSPGLVIRYAFLWSHERRAGADEATKDRPCAIVVATPRDLNMGIRVIVAPITHRPPDVPADSIEIAVAISRNLGLDGDRHWLRLDELNRFIWPGYDLRAIPGRPGIYTYGMMPRDLFERLRQSILAREKEKRLRIQARD
jgi:hypothetical protein